MTPENKIFILKKKIAKLQHRINYNNQILDAWQFSAIFDLRNALKNKDESKKEMYKADRKYIQKHREHKQRMYDQVTLYKQEISAIKQE